MSKRIAFIDSFLLLAIPAVLFIGAFFIVPVGSLMVESFRAPADHAASTITFSVYGGLLSDPYQLEMLGRTMKLSVITTSFTLVLGFPVALHMRQMSGRGRSLITFLLLSPLLTSVVVRTLAWVILLSPKGPIANLFTVLGLPFPSLINNEIGVVIGLTHVFFGYMVLCLMTSILKIDENLLRAASNLGAGRWRILWTVILPLSLPGIFAGSILVFAMSASAYATPAMLGGSNAKVIAMEIYDAVVNYLDWREASALSTILFVLTATSVWLMSALAERGRWRVIPR